MRHYPKNLAFTTPLMLLAAINGALAQTPSTQPAPRGNLGAWITGHPVVDLIVVVAIVAAGTYLVRQRSRV